MSVQPTLFDPLCSCGQAQVQKAGLCHRCYFARWHSQQHFNGLREKVLARDDNRCQACPRALPPIVHHRKPDATEQEDFITICAACHARVHRLRSIRYWMPELLRDLWVEQHPGAPVQMQLSL